MPTWNATGVPTIAAGGGRSCWLTLAFAVSAGSALRGSKGVVARAGAIKVGGPGSIDSRLAAGSDVMASTAS